MTGSRVHVLLVPARDFSPVGPSKPLERTVRAMGARRESWKMLRTGRRLVRGKESWALRRTQLSHPAC